MWANHAILNSDNLILCYSDFVLWVPAFLELISILSLLLLRSLSAWLCPRQWLDLYTKPSPFSDPSVLLMDSCNSAPPMSQAVSSDSSFPTQHTEWTVPMMVFNLWSMVCCWARVDLPLSLFCYHRTPQGLCLDRADSHYFSL